jgi:hypothetical protein
MDHPCHKCGQAVEDGTAFCARCGAPQIRVAIAQPMDAAVVGTAEAGALSETAPSQPFASIRWQRALPVCAGCALTAALLMVLGLMVPFLAVLGAGFFAVALYRRKTFAASIKPWTGAQLGAVCGVFSFGFGAIFEAIAVALFHSGPQIREKMLQALQQAASRTNDPQAQAILDYFKSPPGMALMMIFFLIFALLFFVLLGGIGGAIAGAFLRRKNPL